LEKRDNHGRAVQEAVSGELIHVIELKARKNSRGSVMAVKAEMKQTLWKNNGFSSPNSILASLAVGETERR
jgi:hypothetical protein